MDRTIYYSSLENDDFAGTKIETAEIGEDFEYIRKGRLWRAASAALYYGVAVPVLMAYCRVFRGLKIVNRKALRSVGESGVFLYGNHTQKADAFLGHMIAAPKRTYIIAHADAVSIKGIRNIVMMLGCLPIPSSKKMMGEFLEAAETRVREGGCIVIYPEAHIWPYYTGIRPYKATSFHYPARWNVPVIAMTTTYRKRKGLFRLCKKPGMTVTLSEAMYPDMELPPKKRQQQLRDYVYDFMTRVAGEPGNVEYIRYRHISERDEGC
jgi:1-acyl-sn-glycerol-3-phosphate acyltransferase